MAPSSAITRTLVDCQSVDPAQRHGAQRCGSPSPASISNLAREDCVSECKASECESERSVQVLELTSIEQVIFFSDWWFMAGKRETDV